MAAPSPAEFLEDDAGGQAPRNTGLNDRLRAEMGGKTANGTRQSGVCVVPTAVGTTASAKAGFEELELDLIPDLLSSSRDRTRPSRTERRVERTFPIYVGRERSRPPLAVES